VTDLLYGLAMLGALGLAVAGLFLWRRDRRRSLLLLAAALVTAVNVLSWSTLPRADQPDGLATRSGG
jgi:hypothetical protein